MVEKLTGKCFGGISYAADMLCLNIGDAIACNGTTAGSEFSLHIQCQWRFVGDGEILLASRDMYVPANPNAPDSWYDDYFNGLTNDESLFVESLPDFHGKMRGCVIARAEFSPVGDLKIEFSNGVYFESFTPSSRKDEFWRAIDFKTGEHFVLYAL